MLYHIASCWELREPRMAAGPGVSHSADCTYRSAVLRETARQGNSKKEVRIKVHPQNNGLELYTKEDEKGEYHSYFLKVLFIVIIQL